MVLRDASASKKHGGKNQVELIPGRDERRCTGGLGKGRSNVYRVYATAVAIWEVNTCML